MYYPVFVSAIIATLLFIASAMPSFAAPISVVEERTSITQFSQNTHFTAQNGYNTALSVPAALNSFSYTSQIITPSEPINALGVVFNGDFDHNHSGGHTVEALAHIQSPAGDYTVNLPILHGDGKTQLSTSQLSTSPVMVTDVESYTIEVTLLKNGDAHSARIDSMEVIALNTGTQSRFGIAETESTDSELKIISREEWGADESYRFISTETTTEEGETETIDEEIWPATLQDKKAFIVHHTAGTDGGSDPSASVRAIYYWHAVVLGWGDIGYNYLIDPDGNVYEGRHGGVRAKGAHAYNSVDKIDFNTNTVGIALLGCFEETPGACHTVHTSTEKMDESLALLIANASNTLGIDPTTTTTLNGQTIERIVGHRDVDYTYCPGSGVHNSLDTIRTATANVFTETQVEIDPPLLAEYTQATIHTLDEELIERTDLLFANRYEITVEYTNTGTETWTKEGLKLKAFHRNKKNVSPLRDETWNGKYGGIQMNEESVAPGETATFTFIINSPKKPGNKRLFTKLYHSGDKVKGSNSFTKLSYTAEYTGDVSLESPPLASFAGDTHTIRFTLTNNGDNDWPEDSLGMFSQGKQITAITVPALAVGESAELSFEWTAPETTGITYLRSRAKQNGYRIPGTRFAIAIRVDAN